MGGLNINAKDRIVLEKELKRKRARLIRTNNMCTLRRGILNCGCCMQEVVTTRKSKHRLVHLIL